MDLHEQQPNAGYATAAFEVSERGRARSLLERLAEARATSGRALTPLYSPKSAYWLTGFI